MAAIKSLFAILAASQSVTALVAGPRDNQITLHPSHPRLGKSFPETSIFRPLAEGEVDESASAAPPSFHIYDNFGKDSPMPGIATYAHLNWTNCFDPANDKTFDFGIVGMSFNLGVSYRPGQRFGPAATRSAAQKMAPFIAWR